MIKMYVRGVKVEFYAVKSLQFRFDDVGNFADQVCNVEGEWVFTID